MPTQYQESKTPKYAVGDTAPPLWSRLLDGEGDPIDLTGCTVVINIAHASRDYYYAPMARIVDGGACSPDPDQDNNKGWVSWAPGATDLSIAGTFRYNYVITYPDTKTQTVSPDGNNTMTVRAPLGGMQYA